MEVFVKSPSFPDYLIGSFGTVVRAVNGKTRRAGHVLTAVPAPTGHLRVKLSKLGKKHFVGVHRLVAEAHVGPPPFMGALVRHYDDVPSNNCVLNLFWGTHMDNHNDRRRNGNSFHGERNGRSKLTVAQAAAIKSGYDGSYGCSARIARQFGVGWTCVDDIIKGRKWKEEIESHLSQGR